MLIVACIKQVPDTTQVQIDPVTNTLVREGIPIIVNPYDTHAIEESLRLKDRFGVRVAAISMGPPNAEATLRKALAVGVDEAVLLSDRVFGGADTLATSNVLSEAIRRLGEKEEVGLVICGKQTIDGDTAQVGPGIAKRLGLQLLSYVSRIAELDLTKRQIVVERRAEGGVQVLRTAVPCLITMLENTNEMRFAPMDNMIRAARYEVRKWNKDAAGIQDIAKIGLKGSPTVVSKVFGPSPREEKAEVVSAETSAPRDMALNILQMIFTRKPELEAQIVGHH